MQFATGMTSITKFGERLEMSRTPCILGCLTMMCAVSITGTGFLATSPPPGAPPAATQFTLAITAGRGAFRGIRGQICGRQIPRLVAVHRSLKTQARAARSGEGEGCS